MNQSIDKDILKLLNAHDLIMEQGFKGLIPMIEAEKSQLKLQARIMELRRTNKNRRDI